MNYFPKDFLWGGATSALQFEGGFREGGRGDIVYDYLTVGSREKPRKITEKIDSDKYYPSHNGSDFYHRYKEDIQLLGELGLKVFRMSINWARIFPNGDDEKPNEAGIRFYHDVFNELHKFNIEPLVTIFHAEMPYHLAKKYDGWYNRKTIDFYLKYCKVIFNEYKNDVKYWLTFNEINSMLLKSTAYWYCGIASAKTRTQGSGNLKENQMHDEDDLKKQYQAVHHALVASAKATLLGHSINSNFKIGCMIGGICQYPYTCDPEDIFKTEKERQRIFWYASDIMVRGEYPSYSKRYFEENQICILMEEEDAKILKEGIVDFYSFSYYSTGCVTVHDPKEVTGGNLTFGAANPYLKTSDWGWQIDPVGLRYFLNIVYDRYKIPIMVVENGLGENDKLIDNKVHDPYRIEYLREHIKAISEAIHDGVNVIGYTPWGIVDLCSVSTGEMSKRYGVIYVDADDRGNGTYNRYKKDSFYWYSKVIESNGEFLE